MAEVHVVERHNTCRSDEQPAAEPRPGAAAANAIAAAATDSPHVVQMDVVYRDLTGIDEEAALLVQTVEREIAAVDGHRGPARQVECQQVRGQVDIARDVDDVIAGGCGIYRSD